MMDKIDKIKNCNSEEELMDLLGSLSMELLEKNYPYIPRIISQVRSINDGMEGNGVVHLELKIYKGEVSEATFHEVTKVKF